MRTVAAILCTLLWSGFFAPRSGATVYHSDGSLSNVQALQDAALDGDVITLPAGTFRWPANVNITKGITLQGLTTITGAGTSNPTVTDATIIQDDSSHNTNQSGIVKVALNPTQSFRLTGITFRHGRSTAYASDGAVRVSSSGVQPNRFARIDHCHFDHLYWGYVIWISGWIYGVDDHNVFDCNAANLSHLIWHDTWGGHRDGNGSWADFPYYGTERFWFIEDNTVRGNGPVTSGAIDCMNGGRYVARHNFFSNCSPGGHGTEGGPQRGARAREVYDNTFNWTIGWGGHMQRSGGALWHDNAWTGVNSGNSQHTGLALYREIGAIGNDLSDWGLAGGNNSWDMNDPHGLYEFGVSFAHLAGGSLQDALKNWTTNQWTGYSITNINPLSACYLHSSYIISNTSNTITYYYYGSGDRGAPLVFNVGDLYQIYRVFTAMDQNGRGKGNLISAETPPAWPNEALEPCFSWNNVHPQSSHVYGFVSRYPTEIANRDYYNLGAGFPPDTTPQQVRSTYIGALNGVDYLGSYIYPHPLTLLPGGTARAVVTDFNGDGSPDFVLRNPRDRQTAIWYLNNNVFVGSDSGPTLPASWDLRCVADFNRDSHPDYGLFAPNTDQTAIWYLSGPTFIGSAYGPTLPSGWALVAAADFNGDGKPDYVLYNAGTRQTAIWYLNNNVFVSGAYGPTLPAGWGLVGVADFNSDSHPDYALFNSTTRQTAIWYLSGPTLIGTANGPTVPTGWALVATADFNGDGKPDYLLYSVNTQQTGIYYLNNNILIGAAWGPTLPPGWSFFGP